MLLTLLPVSFVLLRFGEPYGLTDLVGVVIVGGLWFLLPRVLKPWIVVRDQLFAGVAKSAVAVALSTIHGEPSPSRMVRN